MKVDLITKEDLADFKMQLIGELKTLLAPQSTVQKKWLRSAEVRKMLNVSPGTLQNLRINGTLPFTKVGSISYYELTDIEKISVFIVLKKLSATALSQQFPFLLIL